MASKEELYISLTPEVYRLNKSQVLSGQADLLKTLKHLYNLKVISKQKAELKIRLRRLLLNTLKDIETIKNVTPSSKIPKVVRHVEKKVSEISFKHSPKDSINAELKEIQKKLNALNSM